MVEHYEAASGEAVLRGMSSERRCQPQFRNSLFVGNLTVRAPNSTRVSRIWFSKFMPQLHTMNPDGHKAIMPSFGNIGHSHFHSEPHYCLGELHTLLKCSVRRRHRRATLNPVFECHK
jgi:hypothetical protein